MPEELFEDVKSWIEEFFKEEKKKEIKPEEKKKEIFEDVKRLIEDAKGRLTAVLITPSETKLGELRGEIDIAKRSLETAERKLKELSEIF
jgi:hypothetical protein